MVFWVREEGGGVCMWFDSFDNYRLIGCCIFGYMELCCDLWDGCLLWMYC